MGSVFMCIVITSALLEWCNVYTSSDPSNLVVNVIRGSWAPDNCMGRTLQTLAISTSQLSGLRKHLLSVVQVFTLAIEASFQHQDQTLVRLKVPVESLGIYPVLINTS